MIGRAYDIEKLVKKGKVLVIFGARQVGKTTLLNTFLNSTKLKYRIESGENNRIKQLLSETDFKALKEYTQGYDLIAIDEAQQIPNIGNALKILVDECKVACIVTGSSSFNLMQAVGEPLTGRKRTILLYPVSQLELSEIFDKHDLKDQLHSYLLYGGYPEIITANTQKDKVRMLTELAESYLLKDILQLDRIKASWQLIQMLKLLALQIGNEVSFNELATQVNLDVKTIGKYIDLLEKGFVIKRLGGFSRNLRNEITSKAKYYFYDNGIRNALIGQFMPLDSRSDKGALFENFIIMERIKSNEYKNNYVSSYFWRTHTGKEIDLIEESKGKLHAYEIKYSETKKAKMPDLFKQTYPTSTYKVVNKENYLDFVT